MKRQPNAPGNATGNPSANVMFYVMLLSAAMIAVLGTVLPGMLAFDDVTGLVLRCALYAVAIGDVIIALWFRSKLRKGDQAAKSSGTVQRQ